MSGATFELGQRVRATRSTAICAAGELGVVYEVYERKWGRARMDAERGAGVSVIFEHGGYDGFSPDEQRAMLAPLPGPTFCPFARAYRFHNVGRVADDWRAGRFSFAADEARS